MYAFICTVVRKGQYMNHKQAQYGAVPDRPKHRAGQHPTERVRTVLNATTEYVLSLRLYIQFGETVTLKEGGVIFRQLAVTTHRTTTFCTE